MAWHGMFKLLLVLTEELNIIIFYFINKSSVICLQKMLNNFKECVYNVNI